jgi:hypothetical protein
MIKCIIGTVIVGTTTGLFIYYLRQNANVVIDDKNKKCDVQTQTQTCTESTTPPNETNMPDFISVERPPIDNTPARRSTSFASFFNYMRNTTNGYA